jgi:hypothetical protein
MTEASFDSTAEFQRFREVMGDVLTVSKKRMDELVRKAKDRSPRNGASHSPGRKRAKREK